jgi:primosomal protein N' (replication factor Y) (superfamily II helicase)
MHEAQIFARVVVPGPLREPLVYSIPCHSRERVVLGSRVLVPLQRRTVTGVVWEVLAQNPIEQAKPILEVLDDRPILNEQLIKLCGWISHYYLASLGEVLATMLPPNSRRESRRTVILNSDSVRVDDGVSRKIIDELQLGRGKSTVKALARKLAGQNIDRVLARLESSGAIRIEERLAQQRTRTKDAFVPAMAATHEAPIQFNLTAEQGAALGAIEKRIEAGGFETFLLHGVTGSGKTEVYLRAMERVRELRRRCLILIPEISLTPQLLDRLNARFPGLVGVLHSGLTDAERWSQWKRIACGRTDIVIGARSAVFAPVPDLGLIVVDEEHDPSYKQEEGVRYNARDVAIVRGRISSCPVVLGSATPALESYENCRQGRYRLVELTQRVEARPLPRIETVDLRRSYAGSHAGSSEDKTATVGESKDFERSLLSDPLAQAIEQNLERGLQTLIFLNRRGFANFLQCTSCGEVWRCPHCSVTLTLHLKQKLLTCHHCDYRRPTTETCPQCHNPTLTRVGAGTEQIEEVLRRLFPRARTARMDRDTTSQRGAQEQLIRRWEKAELDILVGTQMITKGHDVYGVTVVGALLADLSLNLPDFRAAERTFQLLSQVAGRSGRGEDPGLVLIQTFAPDHYAIDYLIRHDYQGFFNAEAAFRRALNYPPFSRLVALRLDGPKAEEVEKAARELALKLREIQTSDATYGVQIEVLGPAAAPIEKLRNRYRWQLLLKGKQSSTLLDFARQVRRFVPRERHVRLNIDVDPYGML